MECRAVKWNIWVFWNSCIYHRTNWLAYFTKLMRLAGNTDRFIVKFKVLGSFHYFHFSIMTIYWWSNTRTSITSWPRDKKCYPLYGNMTIILSHCWCENKIVLCRDLYPTAQPSSLVTRSHHNIIVPIFFLFWVVYSPCYSSLYPLYHPSLSTIVVHCCSLSSDGGGIGYE